MLPIAPVGNKKFYLRKKFGGKIKKKIILAENLDFWVKMSARDGNVISGSTSCLVQISTPCVAKTKNEQFSGKN